MFAIAFDLVVRATEVAHSKSVSQAYADINTVLNRYGSSHIQGSVNLSQTDSLVSVTAAMNALKTLPWFSMCVRDLRAFEVEHWSDFTDFIKS